MDEMGQTGAGIAGEDDIDLTPENLFTSKWGRTVDKLLSRVRLTILPVMIKDACPWFFNMCDLIAEWPNLVPTGLGNSRTAVDLSVLQADVEGEVDEEGLGVLYNKEAKEIMADTTEPSGVSSFSEDSEAIELTDTNDPPPANPPVALKAETMPSTLPGTKVESKPDVGLKRKAEMIEADPWTPARPGTSKAAALKTMMAKKSKLQEFSAAAQAEEITRQKEIELAKAKVEAAVMFKVEAGKAVLSAKVEFHKHNADERSEKQKLKHELRLLQARQKHELQMACLNNHINEVQPPSTFPVTTGSSSAVATPSSPAQSLINLGFDIGDDFYTPATTKNTYLPSYPTNEE